MAVTGRSAAGRHRSSTKSARATDCRTKRRRLDGRQDRVHRSRSRRGLPVIEVTAFVSPKWVPQMADAAEVLAGITRRPGTRYAALVPNLHGLERALAAGVTDVAVFAAASETFSRRNINQSIDDSLDDLPRGDAARAARGRLRVRGYLSTRSAARSRATCPVARVSRSRRGAARHRRLRGRGQRHDRHRAPRPGHGTCSPR